MNSDRRITLVGTGSFAAEVVDWCRAAEVTVGRLVELVTPERVGTEIHGLPVVASEALEEGEEVAVALGGDRPQLTERFADVLAAPVVHPSAVIAAGVSLGPGVVVGPGAVVGSASRLGRGCLVNRGVLLGHHAEVGEACVLNPGVNVGGNTSIGDGAVLGMGAIVVNGLSIGAGAVIAAGAVAVRDVEPGVRVQGVPARPHGAPT